MEIMLRYWGRDTFCSAPEGGGMYDRMLKGSEEETDSCECIAEISDGVMKPSLSRSSSEKDSLSKWSSCGGRVDIEDGFREPVLGF